MKKLFLVILILASIKTYAQDVALPPLTGPVVDMANLLKQEQVKALSAKSLALQNSKGSQIAVCIVSTTAPLTIEQYGIKLGEKWKIGRAKIADGIIIIVAKDDRKMRIEVGRGLEGTITDLRAGRIIDTIMKPNFKQGDFYKGIDLAMDALITFINGGDIPGISDVPSSASSTVDPFNSTQFNIGLGLIIAAVFIFIVLAAMKKILISLVVTFVLMFIALYLMGTGLIGEVAAISGFAMIPFVLMALGFKYGKEGSGSSSSSGYSISSYSSSDYSSSSSSSSDSYSGGGGDFGGGGASGDW